MLATYEATVLPSHWASKDADIGDATADLQIHPLSQAHAQMTFKPQRC